MNILITGGAGFIGSHLVDYLIKDGHKIVCVDDLSLGRVENINHHKKNPSFRFIKLDVLDNKSLDKVFKENKFECVFHLCANSDIRESAKYPDVDLKKTFMTTFNVLDCMRNNNVKQMVFTSSSAVYGELDKALDEETGPLFPSSFYGAAKLSSEAFISAFCTNYGIKSWILRFPNVVGERAMHGAVFDFMNKLKKNPKELEILGDGKQEKPYCYVKELVDGIIFAWKNSNGGLNCFNLGVESSTTVTRIAEIVVEEMGLKNVKFRYSGGSRGWIGDVPRYSYNLSKIRKLGWKAKMSSDEAVRTAVRAMLVTDFNFRTSFI